VRRSSGISAQTAVPQLILGLSSAAVAERLCIGQRKSKPLIHMKKSFRNRNLGVKLLDYRKYRAIFAAMFKVFLLKAFPFEKLIGCRALDAARRVQNPPGERRHPTLELDVWLFYYL